MTRVGRPPVAPEIRFFRYVAQEDDCWLWTGTTNNDYGHFWAGDGRRQYAHRWSYEYFLDEIPDGLTLDHLCRNRSCVNPWHLDPVPIRINTLRGDGPTARRARQTHCRQGHPLDETRNCRPCRLARYKRYHDKKRQQRKDTTAA